MEKDSDMILISKVARETGVPAGTIRYWALHGELSVAEFRETGIGSAWYTTIQAVKERDAKRSKRGRPRKIRDA